MLRSKKTPAALIKQMFIIRGQLRKDRAMLGPVATFLLVIMEQAIRRGNVDVLRGIFDGWVNAGTRFTPQTAPDVLEHAQKGLGPIEGNDPFGPWDYDDNPDHGAAWEPDQA